MRYEKDGTLIRRFEFSYDDSGNRASQLDVTPTKAVKWLYLYDWLDRLEVVKRAEAVDLASLPGTIPTVSIYTFDASDNRIEFRVEQEDLTYRYVVDDADNLTEIHLTDGTDPEVLIETLEADEDGNLVTRTNELTDEVITYGWDDHNKLIRVSSAISGTPTTTVKEHNRYGVDGIRKRKLDKNGNASSEYTAGISTAVDKAGTSSTKPTLSYIMGPGQILGYEEGNGNWRYFLPDAIGSVRDVVDDSGSVIRSMEFSEYGDLISSSGSGTLSPKTWIGGLSVNDDTADSGLYLMGHRHYAGGLLGRFISRDPIGFQGGLGLLVYAANSPISISDEFGLAPSDPPGFFDVKKFVEQLIRPLEGPVRAENIDTRINGPQSLVSETLDAAYPMGSRGRGLRVFGKEGIPPAPPSLSNPKPPSGCAPRILKGGVGLLGLFATLQAAQRVANADDQGRAASEETGALVGGAGGGALGGMGALAITGATGPVGWVVAIGGGLLGGYAGSEGGASLGRTLCDTYRSTPNDVWHDVMGGTSVNW